MQASFPFIVADKHAVFNVCHYSKHKKLPFNNSFNSTSHSFELIHFYVWGPLAIKSYNGHLYIFTVVDDFTRFTLILLMKSKAETWPNVINFIKLIETQHKTSAKCVRIDNGPEFIMPNYYASKGILHQTSNVKSPQ